MQLNSRMRSDLMCGFGFNKRNAELAMERYAAGELTPAEQRGFDYLKERDPFRLRTEDEPLVLQTGLAQLMNQLNYKLSEGN